jgi:hypothetical protein
LSPELSPAQRVTIFLKIFELIFNIETPVCGTSGRASCDGDDKSALQMNSSCAFDALVSLVTSLSLSRHGLLQEAENGAVKGGDARAPTN